MRLLNASHDDVKEAHRGLRASRSMRLITFGALMRYTVSVTHRPHLAFCVGGGATRHEQQQRWAEGVQVGAGCHLPDRARLPLGA